MSSRPVLLRGRWLAGHLLALVMVGLFINFGFWQLRRLEQRRAVNAVMDSRAHLPPQPLASALPVGSEVPQYLPVTVVGTFDPEHEVLLRGRSLDGRPGFNLLTPLVLDDDSAGEYRGGAVLIERGWVPYDHDSVPVADALPPTGSVTVSGELRAPQSPPTGPLAAIAAHDPPDGPLVQSFYVDVKRLAPQMPYPLVPAYVVLRQQTPPNEQRLPEPIPANEMSEGPHLGYALQWFGMALVGAVGYVFLTRSAARQKS
ncbi:MAG TPA: SURF1 family protein [Trueperaceae bacterium]|nr:SURF1 family protein [Trueperaceae bacterium]